MSAPAGRCLLEWEGEGEPPLPLLKDMFASERRKAKVRGLACLRPAVCRCSLWMSVRNQ